MLPPTSVVHGLHRPTVRAKPWHRPGEATARATLLRLQDRQQIRAAVLALILTPGSRLEHQCWSEETAQVAAATSLHTQAARLSAMTRVPVLEALLKHLAHESSQSRSQIRLSARRIMCADGRVGPLARLHWLLIRHLTYADATTAPSPSQAPSADIPSRLPVAEGVKRMDSHQKKAWAEWTAYLARLVPYPETSATGDIHAAGLAWYHQVMAQIWPHPLSRPSTFQAPDVDQLVNALFELQALSKHLRPLIVRSWLDCLPKRSVAGRADEPDLSPEAAEALRIACRLIDTPLPETLEAAFI